MPGQRMRAAPLAAVDEVTLTSGTEVTAIKAVHVEDPYLAGHYPDFPIYPGVFILESVNQTIDHYVSRVFGEDRSADLTMVTSLRFTSPLLPGDTLHVYCKVVSEDRGLTVQARCNNADGDTAAKMKLAYRMADKAG